MMIPGERQARHQVAPSVRVEAKKSAGDRLGPVPGVRQDWEGNMMGTSGRRRRWRLMSGLAAAAALAVTLTACGSSGKSGSSASGGSTTSGTIRFQSLSFLAAQNAPIIKAFEAANPGIKVEVDSISSAQINTNGTVLSSSDPPDIGVVNINSPVFTQLSDAHQLTALNGVWSAASLKHRYGTGLAEALLAGQSSPYVVATEDVYYGFLAYNATLFRKLGIPLPADHRFASLAALRSACTKLKAAGYSCIALGGDNAYSVSNLFDPLLPTSASASQLTNYLTSWNRSVPVTAKYTAPAFVDALTQLNRMNSDGMFQNGFLGQSIEQAAATFQSQKSGLYASDATHLASLHKDVTFSLDWALLPPANASAKTQNTVFLGTYGIPAHAKNKALAEKFLDYYMSEAGQLSILKTNVDVPIVNDLPTAQLAADAPDSLVGQILQDSAKNGLQLGWTSAVPGSVGQTLINPLIEQMFLDQTSPAKIVSAVQAALAEERGGK
jgi:raffinose/stachyose/melibiose transport system substrate-binding protein